MQTAELSNAMVRLYKELFGRGPTKSSAAYAGPDLLVCTLENSLTQAERKLVELGEQQRLRDVRMFFQHSSESEFVRTVEADHRPHRAGLRERHRHRARRLVRGVLPRAAVRELAPLRDTGRPCRRRARRSSAARSRPGIAATTRRPPVTSPQTWRSTRPNASSTRRSTTATRAPRASARRSRRPGTTSTWRSRTCARPATRWSCSSTRVGRAERSGVAVDARAAWLVTVAAGQVARLRLYRDRAEALAVIEP